MRDLFIGALLFLFGYLFKVLMDWIVKRFENQKLKSDFIFDSIYVSGFIKDQSKAIKKVRKGMSKSIFDMSVGITIIESSVFDVLVQYSRPEIGRLFYSRNKRRKGNRKSRKSVFSIYQAMGYVKSSMEEYKRKIKEDLDEVNSQISNVWDPNLSLIQGLFNEYKNKSEKLVEDKFLHAFQLIFNEWIGLKNFRNIFIAHLNFIEKLKVLINEYPKDQRAISLSVPVVQCSNAFLNTENRINRLIDYLTKLELDFKITYKRVRSHIKRLEKRK